MYIVPPLLRVPIIFRAISRADLICPCHFIPNPCKFIFYLPSHCSTLILCLLIVHSVWNVLASAPSLLFTSFFVMFKPRLLDECLIQLIQVGIQVRTGLRLDHSVYGLQTCSWMLRKGRKRRCLVFHRRWRVRTSPLQCQSHHQEPPPHRNHPLTWLMSLTL